MFENMTFKTTRNRRPYFGARVTDLAVRRRRNFQRALDIVSPIESNIAHTPMMLFASVR